MINAIVIDEINPMSSAPRDGTTILLAYQVPIIEIFIFTDGWFDKSSERWIVSIIQEYKDEELNAEFRGWIPMIVYNP